MDKNPNDVIIRQTAHKYYRLFRSYAQTFLDPEDLIQEIYLKLFAKGLYNSTERALVRYSAKNICLDLLRETVPGFRTKDIEPTPASIDDPDLQVELSGTGPTNTIIDVRQCLESELNDRERKVVLRQLKGHTQSEIADHLGISQQRVWKIRREALDKLRLKMAESLLA